MMPLLLEHCGMEADCLSGDELRRFAAPPRRRWEDGRYTLREVYDLAEYLVERTGMWP